MSEMKRCALLDTDFISKLYITKASDSDRLIYRILSIEDFHFMCHKQTSIELARHNCILRRPTAAGAVTNGRRAV